MLGIYIFVITLGFGKNGMETSRRLAGGFTTNQQQQEVTVVGSRFGLEPLSNKDAHDFSLVVVMVDGA